MVRNYPNFRNFEIAISAQINNLIYRSNISIDIKYSRKRHLVLTKKKIGTERVPSMVSSPLP